MTYDEASEIVEKIADQLGVYGVPDMDLCDDGHPENCNCRICFVLEKTDELLKQQPELFNEI